MAKYSDEDLISATLGGEFDDSPGKKPEVRLEVRRDIRHVQLRMDWTDEEWGVMTMADLLVLLKVLGDALTKVNQKIWTRQRQSLSARKKGGF